MGQECSTGAPLHNEASEGITECDLERMASGIDGVIATKLHIPSRDVYLLTSEHGL